MGDGDGRGMAGGAAPGRRGEASGLGLRQGVIRALAGPPGSGTWDLASGGETWCNGCMPSIIRTEAPGQAPAHGRPWRRDELVAAFRLYCMLPFGKLHQRNPQIIALAEALGRTPGSVALKLVNLASLDPAITGTGRSGMANASAGDREIWAAFHSDWTAMEAEGEEVARRLGILEPEPELPEAIPWSGETSVETLVKVRRGQAFFRKAVLGSYEGRCCMSGIGEPLLLLASHIVPWARDEANRLNPANGLCLSALHDRAFDQGLITVDADYRVKVAPVLKAQGDNPLAKDWLLGLEGQRIRLPKRFRPDPDFLAWHQRERFLAG